MMQTMHHLTTAVDQRCGMCGINPVNMAQLCEDLQRTDIGDAGIKKMGITSQVALDSSFSSLLSCRGGTLKHMEQMLKHNP
jgi:hypothetical protein